MKSLPQGPHKRAHKQVLWVSTPPAAHLLLAGLPEEGLDVGESEPNPPGNGLGRVAACAPTHTRTPTHRASLQGAAAGGRWERRHDAGIAPAKLVAAL